MSTSSPEQRYGANDHGTTSDTASSCAVLHVSERTRVRQRAARGRYDRATIDSILDERLVCHVAFVVSDQPYAIPTAYGRSGDTIYIHGSTVSRMLRALSAGVDVCLTVTLVDGLVLARSAFHHSMNYRSVVVLGRARLVADEDEKLAALHCITKHIVPGRWDEVRSPTRQELDATTVLALRIEEASAKVRTGPPLDAEADYTSPAWAGVVPMALEIAEPQPDARVPAGSLPPDRKRLLRRRKVANDV